MQHVFSSSHVITEFSHTLTSALSCLVSGVLMFATCVTCHVSTIDSRAPGPCTSASAGGGRSLEAGPATP